MIILSASLSLTLNMDAIHYQPVREMWPERAVGTPWHSDPSQPEDMTLSVSDEYICHCGDNSLNLGFHLPLEEMETDNDLASVLLGAGAHWL